MRGCAASWFSVTDEAGEAAAAPPPGSLGPLLNKQPWAAEREASPAEATEGPCCRRKIRRFWARSQSTLGAAFKPVYETRLLFQSRSLALGNLWTQDSRNSWPWTHQGSVGVTVSHVTGGRPGPP